ncbi:MAG: bifunctional glutamate N-acetyltransferase/amino-acid acetyltransferase ArgJ [Clostridia bacterium]|nr:bifunctional glutamate N-acetyltransferase/amino-acid acetyltransferase ArgJ [Clostridia bacterium]
MKKTEGGVCAPKGFTANGVLCGIKKNSVKNDLSLIFSEVPASAAAVYTTNLVKGAPLKVTRRHLQNGIAQAAICNSGNANTCNANGVEVAEQTCALLAGALDIAPDDVIVASTGVIGQPLDITPIKNGIPSLAAGLSADGSDAAARGIMTTDTVKKEVAYEFEIDGAVCRIGGIAKGSGMIHPNMATMLVFITSDVSISPEMLQTALSENVKDTFNMISVDGDTSTNDMVCVMANGMAGNERIVSKGGAFDAFTAALDAVTVYLCRAIAADGEGATRLMECRVNGARDETTAKTVAKSVVCSNLTKAAIFGADANWGRVICAMGYSGADIDPEKADIFFKSSAGCIKVCQSGFGVDFSEEEAKKILLEKEIEIIIDLHDGDLSATARGCDLTYEYVRINGDYRS